MDLAARNIKHVKCSRSYQKSQCRIQSTGNSKHDMAAAGMLQTLFQSHGLNGEDFLTAAASLPRIVRNERPVVDVAEQLFTSLHAGNCFAGLLPALTSFLLALSVFLLVLR